MMRSLFRSLVFGSFLVAAGSAFASPLALAVADAGITEDVAAGGTVIAIKLSPDSATAFGDFTAAHVGHKVSILIDGKSVMEPVILDPIRGGVLEISGPVDRAQWAPLASRLKSGEAILAVEATE